MECVFFVWFHSLLLVLVKFTATGRSEAWVCGRLLAGIAGSNLTGSWMSVFCKCCVLSGRGLVTGRSLLQRNPTECVYVINCDQCNSNLYTYND
jgi:hypothetical protein